MIEIMLWTIVGLLVIPATIVIVATLWWITPKWKSK